ncbi:MAG TPA: glycosyltransferase family 2 protein [Caulobacteraceae bacterium]
MLDQITPLIITLDEAANLERTLNQLRWAPRIVVVDSGSTDGTLEIVSRFPQAQVFYRAFDTSAAQCNFGLEQIRTDWVLSLDADYELSDDLIAELRRLSDTIGLDGYRASFVYRIHGFPLSGSLYPPRAVLYRVASAHYVDEGHTQRVAIAGRVGDLHAPIYHDDRKPLSRWIASQQRYARLEADHLLSASKHRLTWANRVRLAVYPAPLLVLPYVLLRKGCIRDGWPGWLYALQRLFAETMIALELIDRRLRNSAEPSAETGEQS